MKQADTVRKTSREEQYCLLCKSNGLLVIEDEVHFLLNYRFFDEMRKDMLNPIFQKYHTVENLNEESLFIWLLSQEDNIGLERVGKYCNKAFQTRENDF